MARASMLFSLALAPSLLLASGTETLISVDLLAGQDTNPLLLSGPGSGAAFAQLRLGGQVSRSFGAEFGLFGSGAVETRLHQGNAALGDRGGGDLSLGGTWRPARFGHDRLSLTLTGNHSAHRATFVDRATGEVYETAVVPATVPVSAIPVPNRLDYDSDGFFLRARWNQTKRLSFLLDGGLERTDYVEDYAGSTDLESLDYRSFTFQPGLALALGERVALGVSFVLSDLEYESRSAVDADGQPVSTTPRAYRSSRLRIVLRTRAGEAWTVRGGVVGADRRDTYAGYYDSGSVTTYVSADRELGRASRIRLFLSRSDLDYEHATVTNDAGAETLGGEEIEAAGRFERSVSERVLWFVEGGTERSDNKDPIFSYDRDWVLTGIHFER